MISLPLSEYRRMIETHPVLLLSSRRKRSNTLAPVTWYMPLGMDPPMLSISLKPSSQSYHYIRESGDFILGVPGEGMIKAVHFCGIHSGRDIDKLLHLNLSAMRAKTVSPLMVMECMGQIECRVRDIYVDGPRPVITAEVMWVGAYERYYEDGWRPLARLVYYAGGARYRVGQQTIDMSAMLPGYVPPNSIG
ncbi:MAG: hypothetical protein GC154_12105 [bacterium]|nr:hypothetical protein [bacterium]